MRSSSPASRGSRGRSRRRPASSAESVTRTAISTIVCRSCRAPSSRGRSRPCGRRRRVAGSRFVGGLRRCIAHRGTLRGGHRYPAVRSPPAAWIPTPELAATSNVGRFMAAHGFTELRGAAPAVDRRPGVVLGRGRQRSSGCRSRRRTPRCSTSRAGSSGRPGSPAVGSTPRRCASTAGPTTRPGHAIILWEGEEGATPFRDLRRAAHDDRRDRRRARGTGVGDGDAVGVFLPMLPETVATVMAIGQARRHLPPGVLRVRRRGGRGPARGGRGEGARHRRRPTRGEARSCR